MDDGAAVSGEKASFVSILLSPRDDAGAVEQAAEPDCFPDLNLDQIVKQVIASKEEYDLKPFFHHSLRSMDSLTWRHEVFRDLEQPAIANAIHIFSDNMRTLRNYFEKFQKLHYPRQKQAMLLEAAPAYCDGLETLAASLQAASPRSEGLVRFLAWLQNYLAGPTFCELRRDITDVNTALADIRYSLLIEEDSVRVTRYVETEDYSEIIADCFAKFAQSEGQKNIGKFNGYLQMNHVEAGILDRVALLFPKAFEKLEVFLNTWEAFRDPVILRFDREIQFYLSWFDCITRLRGAGLSAVLPELSIAEKTENAVSTYDVALALKLIADKQNVVTNDYSLSGEERVLVITGPNQGGKTTFSRMFGQIHWLASLGLPVPGAEMKLFVFDQLFTHFEREETVKTERGKLEDEIFRVHEILAQATSNSLVIINEIFASTSLSDAIALATQVMQQIIERGCLTVCVTFLDEISRLGPSVVSCTSSVVEDNPAERTFRIARNPADGNAFAIFLARRYQLTETQILERMSS